MGVGDIFTDKAYVAISRYEDLGNTRMCFLKEQKQEGEFLETKLI